ncbi:MAG: hypothetical protein ABI199_08180 [Bacteroidia bacterium]
MKNPYENSDAFIKRTLLKYEVAYDEICWEKLESILPKRSTKKSFFNTDFFKIIFAQKKNIAIGVGSVFVLSILFYFIAFTTPKNNFSKKRSSAMIIESASLAPEKNNFSKPENLPPIKKEISKKNPISVSGKPVLPIKIVLQKNNFSTSVNPILVKKEISKNNFPATAKTNPPKNNFSSTKNQSQSQKLKTDSTSVIAKSGNDANFDFSKSVENKSAMEPSALPDTVDFSRK